MERQSMGFKTSTGMKKNLTLAIASILLCGASVAHAASELYHPAWVDEFAWSMDDRFHSVPGSLSFLEDLRSPWWQSNRVQHPITDYDAAKLGIDGGQRLLGLRFDFRRRLGHKLGLLRLELRHVRFRFANQPLDRGQRQRRLRPWLGLPPKQPHFAAAAIV
jgi:hypothetical protein